jgi:hypothetical protein
MKEITVDIDHLHVTARELRREDLEVLVAYWHDSKPDYLSSLGVDLAKLGTPDETYARLAAGLKRDQGRRAITVVAEVEGEVVAYANLLVVAPDTACAHLHTLRQEASVKSAVYRFFPLVSVAVLKDLGVSRLRFEASVGNRGINRYLQSFGLQPTKVYLEQPDGLARAGEFNIYEINVGEQEGKHQ